MKPFIYKPDLVLGVTFFPNLKVFWFPPPHCQNQWVHCVTGMEHSISDQGLHQGRAFTPARPFAGNFQGSKLGKEVCIRRDLELWGCWGHMGVGLRGRRGKLDLQLRCCQGTRAGRGSMQAGLLCRQVRLGSILCFQLLLPFSSFLLLFSFYSFFLELSLSGTFLAFFLIFSFRFFWSIPQ